MTMLVGWAFTGFHDRKSGVGSRRSEDRFERLQGSWTVISVQQEGKRLTVPGKAVWAFSNEELAIKIAGKAKSKDRIILAPAVTPKAIIRYFTTTIGGDSVLCPVRGIYRLDGETLWVCFGEPSGEFPTEFASKPGSRTTIVVLNRGE